MAEGVTDYEMIIGGRAAGGAAWLDVVNPATERVIGRAPDATRAQLDEAVAAARSAFRTWKRRPIAERQALVRGIGERLVAHVEELSRLLTGEQGKPLADAAMEIQIAAMWCQAYAQMEPPVLVTEDSEVRRSETRHVPIGVVGAIAPWNYPINLALWKVAPALVAGNTVVLKPSPFTPLTTLRMGALLADLLPAGVLNVVSGGDDLGPWMTAHPGIDKIAFTGSTATGKKVMQSATADLKRVTLELGGNDAAIVLPDVDVQAVAEQLFWAAFRNTAQLCIAAKRVYIHEDVYDAVAKALLAYARTIRMGDGSEQGVGLGPIQNRAQFERVKGLIADAKAQGLKFLAGGEVPGGAGFFVPVTIIDNPPDDARVVVEEAFGPVLPLLKFRDDADVIARANDTPYGLAGSVWSKDLVRAQGIADALETGTVWINEIHHLTPFAPFAGHKQSGIGAENGIEGLLEYTNPQTIVTRKTPVAQEAGG